MWWCCMCVVMYGLASMVLRGLWAEMQNYNTDSSRSLEAVADVGMTLRSDQRRPPGRMGRLVA